MIELRKTEVYDRWLRNLRDVQARARINVRVQRLVEGNPGAHRVLTGGVVEMKVDCGPGYRIYFVQHGDVLVVLLCGGGDKSSQQADIEMALQLAAGL